MMKKFVCVLLAVLMLVGGLTACKDDGEVKLLSFSQANSVEEMKKLDGDRVTIIGYMSTLSPVSGKFMYLMNLPYQSCPFCVPNTTQLSNTMAIYAKGNDEFKFTDRAIQVTGTLEFGSYTDEFGYEYNYRIKDATYEVLDTSNMSEELKLWQQLASTDVISDVYTMFEYVNFVCRWTTYTSEFQDGKDYLYASDAKFFLDTEGAQYNYGRKADYFSNIIATIESVDAEAFADLVIIIEKAEELSEQAYDELVAGNYKSVSEYSGEFKDGREQIKLDKSAELESQMDEMYAQFSAWLSGWEL